MIRAPMCAAVLVLGALVASEVSACGFRSAGRISVSRSIKQQTAQAGAALGGSVVLVADAGDAGLEAQLKRSNYKVARATDAASAQTTLGGDKNRLVLAPLSVAEALRGAGIAVVPVVTTANAGAAIAKGFSTVMVKESNNDQKLDVVRKSMPGNAAIP